MMAAWDWRGTADVAELVDALDLGSSAERRVGSTPIIRTNSRSGEPRIAANDPPQIPEPSTSISSPSKGRGIPEALTALFPRLAWGSGIQHFSSGSAYPITHPG